MEPSDKEKAKGWVPIVVGGSEAEHGPDDEGEPEPPDWRFLSDVFQRGDPLFRNVLFLEGCDSFPNIYVIVGDYLTVVDPGNDYTAMMQLFEHPEYAPGDIRKIVLTHGDPDRAMGTMELFRYPSIKNNPVLEIVLHGEGPPGLKKITRQFGVRLTEVEDGQALDLSGFPWTVIHTPGRFEDGICLLHVPTRTLMSGLMDLPGAAAALDERARARMDRHLASMRSLVRHEIENILPAHGLPVASEGGRAVESGYLAVLLKVIGVNREEVPSLFEAASAAARAGLPEDAVLCCNMALAANPDDTRPVKLRAFCLNDLGEFDEAIQAFTLLERRSPGEMNDPSAMTGRGNSYLGLGRYEEGLRCFEKVLETRPDREDALLGKAFALFLSGNVDEAMEIEAFKSGLRERVKEEMLKTVASGRTGGQENA
ncbi:MAG: tetratricopeptide repeat protein [Syntrophobacteraceae bacterium]